MKIKKSHYICIVSLVISLFASAQKRIIPEQLVIEDGLSQSFVSSIMQDEEGFIWMGTKNGLDRYDGRQFENFITDKENPYALQNDFMFSMHDDHGFSLFGTNEGIFLYQKTTKRFYHIELPSTTRKKGEKSAILEIVKDSNGNYWLGDIRNRLLFKLAFTPEFYKQIRTTNFNVNTIITEEIKMEEIFLPNYMCMYKNELVFISAKLINNTETYTFNTLNTQTKKIKKLKNDILRVHWDVFWMKPYKDKLLFSFLGEKKLNIYENEQWHTVQTDFNINTFSPLKNIQKIIFDSGHESLFFDDVVLEKDQILRTEANAKIEDINSYHNDILVDKSGVTWIATSGKGVYKIAPRELQIETLFTGKSIYAKPFIFNSNNIYIDNPNKDERLFVQKNETIKEIPQDALDNMQHWFFVSAKDGQVWGLQWKKGKNRIVKVDTLGSYEEEIVLFESGPPQAPLFYYDAYKNDLVAVYGTELYIYSLDKKSLININLNAHIPNYNHYAITKSSNGYYWIGTNRGLIRCKIGADGKLEVKIWSEENELINNEVACVQIDSKNKDILWFGTKGGGLYKMNIQTNTFQNFNLKDGLPNNVIYGILEDEKNNLWLSSNHGIIVFNKTTHEIKNYTKSDGLQSNEFNTFAFNKAEDGTMLFGGINGLNIFHPDDFEENKNVPEVWITDIKVNNKNASIDDQILQKTIEFTETITLSYAQNNISLTFSALEFTAAQKNTFSYFMEDLETEWLHTTHDNTANYLNIPPGNYMFKIKAANGDGVWGEDVKKLKITILPPWYRTILAYGIYGFLLVVASWFFIKTREEKIKKAEQIEKAKLQNKLLKTEIAYKQKDLFDFATAISENQKWGNLLLEKIKEIRASKGRAKGKSFDELEETIRNKTFIEKNQIDFQDRIDTLNNEFYQTLLAQFPNLSKTDLRLCTLIRLNFSTNDIALLQNIAQESVYKSRNRLRKKLTLSSDVDLDLFLKQF